MTAQTSLLDEIIVDNFAGGGGASTGIELAAGRPVTIAINHDPDAILMHKTNHPYTEHFCESVWDIDPVKVCAGRPVGLAWFSPDCKHHSKARGGKPVEKNIRGLAWVALRWAAKVRPRLIILENVEEFRSWGPVRKGRPVKKKAGQTFRRFIHQLEALGYAVEYRELVAADCGAPTIRKRFFLVARCDGRSIVWPEPTHSKDGADGKKKWRSAAEIIDWSLPCPSIFATKDEIKAHYGIPAVRPLAKNTLRRVARGTDKFVIKSVEPFIVSVNHTASYYDTFRGQGVDCPMGTITARHGYGVVAPSLIQYHSEKSEYVRGQDVREPVMTVDSANRYGVASAYMTEYYGNADRGFDLREPTHTATAKDREGLTLAYMSKYFGGVDGSRASEPLSTVTAIDHNALTAAFVSKFYKTGTGQDVREPLHTVTTSPGHLGAVSTYLAKWDGRTDLHRWPQVRALLNEHCGYRIADDEILILLIGGTEWFISDIGLRMLTPKELYAANGFPPDYIIDRDYLGNEYTKTKQVARCGNAVPPPFATALVRANWPEACGPVIVTMAELMHAVAM